MLTPDKGPLLDVPHYYETIPNSCFPTSLRMVFAYCWGCDIPLDDICMACGTTENGTHILGSISGSLRLMDRYGLDAVRPPELWLQSPVIPPLQRYVQDLSDEESRVLLSVVLNSAILITDDTAAVSRLAATVSTGIPVITFLKVNPVKRHTVVVVRVTDTHVIVKDAALKAEVQPIYVPVHDFLAQWKGAFYYAIVIHNMVAPAHGSAI